MGAEKRKKVKSLAEDMCESKAILTFADPPEVWKKKLGPEHHVQELTSFAKAEMARKETYNAGSLGFQTVSSLFNDLMRVVNGNDPDIVHPSPEWIGSNFWGFHTSSCLAVWVVRNQVWYVPPAKIKYEFVQSGIRSDTPKPRLHCTDGPAFQVLNLKRYFVHGVHVHPWIINSPGLINAKTIDAEPSIEIRSIMIEMIGWPKYIASARLSPIDVNENFVEGTIEALYRCPDGSKRLVVTCPTARIFALQVPDFVNTCNQAQNWLGSEEINAPSRCLFRT